MNRPIFVSAGGTGGGVYPALAVIEAMRRLDSQQPIHFVGSIGGMEDGLVPRPLVDAYHAVYAGPIHGVQPLRLLSSLTKLAAGLVQSLVLLWRQRPTALFITGGWATFPITVASWLAHVPIAIYVPDIEPALAIKVLSRLARQVLVTVPDSAAYFDAGTTVQVVGYPLRQDVLQADRRTAQRHFELDPDRPTVLVFGGSRGARSLNEVLGACAAELLSEHIQLLHISGQLDAEASHQRRAALPAELQADYHLYAYLHEDMGLALAAADVVVSRSGASTLGEFPYFGLPAILVPYPFAWRYQKTNADWLVERGAALRVDDGRLMADLLPTLRALLRDPSRLRAMRQAASALATPDAAGNLAQCVLELAQNK